MAKLFEPNGYTPSRNGLLLLQIAVALLFFIFTMRFWYLQIHKGTEYLQKSQANRLRQEQIYAPRGLLRDRNGVLLAENRPSYALALVREDSADIPATLAQVSRWTGVSLDDLTARYQKGVRLVPRFAPLVLVSDLSVENVANVEAFQHQWPGVRIISQPRRFYPQGESMAHILGYVAEANEKELRKDTSLRLGDSVGKLGIELTWEQFLRGEKGLREMEVDVTGRELQDRVARPPLVGEEFLLSIDVELQKNIYELMKGQAGAVVVMNPDTGELLSLVTAPSYDNNLFVGGLSHKEWQALRDDPLFPLQNRPIQSMYPPGSVWKLMMAGLILEKGISPYKKVFCNGAYPLGNHVFRCWHKYGHGKVDLRKSLIHSCDVYYYDISIELGIDAMSSFATACGFGERTGIDLPYEQRGLVPSREWKWKRYKETWKAGESLLVSIGQGSVLVTPLQMAYFMSAVVNGGTLLRPQLVAHAIPDAQGTLPISPKYCARIKKYMRDTVETPRGTAKVLRRQDAIIGGKTGTAQVVKIGAERRKKKDMEYWERDHAWIASFGEKKGERYVVVVMLEHGGGGGSDAGPVARDVYKLLYGDPPAQAKAKK